MGKKQTNFLANPIFVNYKYLFRATSFKEYKSHNNIEGERKQAGCTGLCSWITLETKADMVDGSPFGEQDYLLTT